MSVQLVLLRHGQCQWELMRRFVGWADTELSPLGVEQATRAGRLLHEHVGEIDVVYTSVLRRATRTAALIVAQLERPPTIIEHSWRLNARHYGALEGLAKPAVIAEHGRQQVHAWRRQVGAPPPALDMADPRHPRHDERYRAIGAAARISTECFGAVRARILAYWHDVLAPQARAGRRVLVVAHGSSLRPLIQHLSGIDDHAIVRVDVPTAAPLLYELDGHATALSWRYLDRRANIAPLLQPTVHRALRAHDVRHVVLSGVPEAPQTPGQEADPALLVAQAHAEAARAIVDSAAGCANVRIFGTHGRAGSDYRKLPYLPPHLAESVLSSRRFLATGVAVPDTRHRQLIRAFDRLYHGSGIDLCDADDDRALAALDDDTLDAYLAAHGWRPPFDLLGRMSWCNPWIRQYLGARTGDCDPDPGLAVFILRAAGMDHGGCARLIEMLDRAGFDVIIDKILSREERARARARVRAGRWDRGPWPASGGGPAAIVVAYDLDPRAPTQAERERFPWLSNGRALVKEEIRTRFNIDVPGAQHCNVVHATDNSPEAWEVIDLVIPDARDVIAARIKALAAAYHTSEPVTRQLTRFARRAKVEVVVRDGSEVVKKTFKPSKLRFHQRERAAAEALGHIPEIPALLGATDNAVFFEYVRGARYFDRKSSDLMSLDVARAAIGALRAVYEAGYALIGARPENLLITETGVKLIDFEFAHRYDRRPARFEDSYDMAGCPDSFAGDRPRGGATSYSRDWQPFIGLPLDSLLHDPVWLQHLKRLWLHIRRALARWLGSLTTVGVTS